MKFVNGQRTFATLQGYDSRGYRKVQSEGKSPLYLPEHVLHNMRFKFSWDEYNKDALIGKGSVLITKELFKRLNLQCKSNTDRKVIEDMKVFLKRGEK